jgi:hypothetical protein
VDEQDRGPIEMALRDLAASLDTGPVPDVAPRVIAQLDATSARPRRTSGWLRAAVTAVVIGLLLALNPAVRSAVADFVRGLPGVLFETDDPAPPVRTPHASLGQPFGLVGAVPLAEAVRQVSFPVLVPTALGEPDEVYVRGQHPSHAVTMLYRARPGLPTLDGSGFGAVVDVIDPSAGTLFEKRLFGIAYERLTVDGRDAVWINRAHPLVLLDEHGTAVETRLASRTLLVYENGVTVRIESLLPKDEAVRLARSLR